MVRNGIISFTGCKKLVHLGTKERKIEIEIKKNSTTHIHIKFAKHVIFVLKPDADKGVAREKCRLHRALFI